MPPPNNRLCLCVALAIALVVFSSLHTPAATSAVDGDTLAAGQALAAGDKLVSRNGKFALGFFQFRQNLPGGGGTGTSAAVVVPSPGWYLGVWFNKIPVCTPVWIANRDRPITESELKVAQLRVASTDGNNKLLVVVTSNTNTSADNSIIIVANTTTNGSSVHVVLTDTGNLVLLPQTEALLSSASAPAASSSSSSSLWQSFDYPTDVGLPGAKIGWTKLAGGRYFSRRFISKKSQVDPSPGSYSISIDTNGFMQLTRNAPSVQYWSWTSGSLGNLVTALTALIDMDPRTKGLLKPGYVATADEVYFTYSITDESASVFVPVDVTGQLKLMLWSDSKRAWETIYAQPSDFCVTSAVCGPFTVCNGNSGPSPSSFCTCMDTFSIRSPRHWELGDLTEGCARTTPLDCEAANRSSNGSPAPAGSTDVFHPIAQVALPLPYNSRPIEDATTQNGCEAACLGDCNCTAYSFSTDGKCSVWNGDLLNVDQADSTISSQGVLYLRLAKSDFQGLSRGNKRTPTAAIAAGAVGSGILVLAVLALVIWRCNNVPPPLHAGVGDGGGIMAFKHTDLCRATKNFSDRLGGGGFGSVFKGLLGDSTAVAVKRLDDARQGEKQFRAEVSSVGMIQHINLVRLIGFCCEGDKRLLVYEHVVNGSLDAHLFQQSSAAAVATALDWSKRYRIAVGVARGLCYLHQSCRECIIHCDIKPENILLDASFAPKIADFGMAAFVGRDFSRVLTTFRGTAGYLAPEWLSGVPITPKVDVYSFGMVVLEIVSGQRNTPPQALSRSGYYHAAAYFPVQAITKLHEGDMQDLVDPRLQGDLSLEEAERLFKVAFWCIQDDECDRPTMADVVRVLEGLQELDMPPVPRLLAAITARANADFM